MTSKLLVLPAAFLGLAVLGATACSSSSTSAPATNDDNGDAGALDASAHPTPSQDSGPTPTPDAAPPPYPYEDGTTVVVGLDTEDFRQTLGMDLEKLHVVATVDGKVASDETMNLRQGSSIPHETVLKAPKGKKDAAVSVKVEGFVPADASGQTPPPGGWPANVVRLASTQFVPDSARVLAIRMESRCASVGPSQIGGAIFLGPTCTAPETCIADKCASSAVNPASLPAYTKTWDTDMPDACRASTPSLAVGGGDTDYVALADGATVQIIEGGQCGHHVWIGVKMAGLRQYGVTTAITSVSPGNAITGPSSSFSFAYGDAGGGACQIGGIRYQLDGATSGSWKDFLGKPIDVTVKVTDPATGKSQTTTAHLNVAADYVKGPRPCG